MKRDPRYKRLSRDKVIEINSYIPLAQAKVKAEIKLKVHTKAQEAERFSFHMDQLTIQAGLRQGRLKGEYVQAVDRAYRNSCNVCSVHHNDRYCLEQRNKI